ncbi:hypothetical protein RchiOBHm_Chr4g0417311 [Rosa chinensis]|uniref:Uncharacterized GPI-anchored protein At5g19230-like domain-containing protein n=2 Tax=Rosa chinensis TaxID=74649 RepID=A0A2P6QX38_ROSCH|nr:hypothetical protein RchiOBHm_Chr4g0417311 [Rosa chinensis]
MPSCVPNLDPSLVLTNFTKSQYSSNLNQTNFTGIGIGSEDNWIVVILTTSTPEGSYVPAQSTDSATGSASLGSKSKISLIQYLLCLLMGFVFHL